MDRKQSRAVSTLAVAVLTVLVLWLVDADQPAAAQAQVAAPKAEPGAKPEAAAGPLLAQVLPPAVPSAPLTAAGSAGEPMVAPIRRVHPARAAQEAKARAKLSGKDRVGAAKAGKAAPAAKPAGKSGGVVTGAARPKTAEPKTAEPKTAGR